MHRFRSSVSTIAVIVGWMMIGPLAGASISESTVEPYPWTTNGPAGTPAGSALSVAASPTTSLVVYAGGPQGFFRSDNAGQHWTELSSLPVDTFGIDPVNPGIIYSQQAGGVGVSTDGGATWRVSSEGLTCEPVVSIAVAPISQTVFVGAVNISHTFDQCQGLFESSDEGRTWSFVGHLEAYGIVIDPTDPEILYAFIDGETGRYLLGTTDGGTTWEWFDVPPNCPPTIDPFNLTRLYVSGNGGFYVSDDRGVHWTDVSPGSPIFLSIAPDPAVEGEIFASTTPEADPSGGGVYRSLDGGRTWRQFGLQGMEVIQVIVDPAGAYVHAAVTGVGVFDRRIGDRRASPVHPAVPAPVAGRP